MTSTFKRKIVVVNDLMQKNYRYELSAPPGEAFDPSFTPELTPPEMLRLGVFGGKYMTDCTAEFPSKWFEGVRFCHEHHRPELNFFGVLAGLPLAVWREKGWIHPDDPRGWFQWYCRYYMGRRCPDDTRQIKRYRAMVRHLAQLRRAAAVNGPYCRIRQRQALLQWGYDTRKF